MRRKVEHDSLMAVGRLLAGVLFMAILLSCAATAAATAVADRFFDQSFGDFKAELATARQNGKRGVLVMFEADGCPYCRRMRQTILNRDDVQEYFRRYFAVFSVDILGSVPIGDFAGHEMTEKEFARRQHVQATPTFVFFALDGSELVRYVGATRNERSFLQLGRFVADGHYERQSFDAFVKSDRER